MGVITIALTHYYMYDDEKDEVLGVSPEEEELEDEGENSEEEPEDDEEF